MVDLAFQAGRVGDGQAAKDPGCGSSCRQRRPQHRIRAQRTPPPRHWAAPSGSLPQASRKTPGIDQLIIGNAEKRAARSATTFFAARQRRPPPLGQRAPVVDLVGAVDVTGMRSR